jgi:hypothetical protein
MRIPTLSGIEKKRTKPIKKEGKNQQVKKADVL